MCLDPEALYQVVMRHHDDMRREAARRRLAAKALAARRHDTAAIRSPHLLMVARLAHALSLSLDRLACALGYDCQDMAQRL